MIDLSFSLTIPVPYFATMLVVVTVIGVFIAYWIIKAIVSVVTGG
jgi:hypothetical protein